MKRDKSKFVVSATILGAMLAGGSGLFTEAGAKELKIATFMSPKHHLNSVVFKNLAKTVGKATGGSTTMKLYSGGQLGKGPVQQYKRVVDNVAELTFIIQGTTTKIFPRTMVVAQPAVGRTAVEVTKKFYSVYDRFLAQEYKRVKVLGLWANTPPVLISKKPIRKLSDLKGLKVRAMSATNIPQINAWGASGLALPITKTYDALDKGVIDSVHVAVNALYRPWRFAEIAKHATDGLEGPTSLFGLLMNKKVWDGLSAADKGKIDGLTGSQFGIETARSWAQSDVKAIAKAKKGVSGVKYHMLSKSEAAPFDAVTAKATEKFLADQEKNGVPARAIYAAITK